MRKRLLALIGLMMVCGLLTACGGSGISIPTIASTPTVVPTPTVNAAATSTRAAEISQLATAQAPTATPEATATPLPPPATATPAATATRPPAATPTRAPSATATRASGTAAATIRPTTQATTSASTSRAPMGAAPAGWKTYAGATRVPFTLYYPPDWKVDETGAASDGKVEFRAPTAGVSFTMQVRTQQTTISIDTLRDAQAKGIAETCKASGVEGTDSETYSGVIFDELVQTCDFGQPPLFVFAIAAGLNNGYPWTFFLSSPYDAFSANVDNFFQPMLDSLRIYANPAG